MLGTRVRGAVSVVGGMAVRVGPTLDRSSSTARGVMLLFFGEHGGVVPCSQSEYGRLVRRAACVIQTDAVSREPLQKRYGRSDTGFGVSWSAYAAASIRTRAARGVERVDVRHCWWANETWNSRLEAREGGHLGGCRRPWPHPPAPPAPPLRASAPLLPHTLAQADSSGGRRSVPRGLSAPSLLPPSPTNRSRQRGWHRPPRGAAREAATADADTQERRDEEDGSGGTREEAAQQPHTTAGHDRWRTGVVRGGPALAPLCMRRTPGARCALRVCTALVPTTGRPPIFMVQWPRGVWWRGCAGCGAWRATGPSNAASGSEIGFSSFRSLALPDASCHL